MKIEMRQMNTAMRLGFLFLMTLVLAGCQSATGVEPLTDSLAGGDAGTRMDFLDQLAERSVTSNDEAFHGLLMFIDGKDGAENYEGRVAALKERGLLADNFDRPANEAVTRGVLAVAIVKHLGITGGAGMRLFGNTPRYATRELRYAGVYTDSSPQQTFSGEEFISLLGRVEESESTFGIRAPAEDEIDRAEAQALLEETKSATGEAIYLAQGDAKPADVAKADEAGAKDKSPKIVIRYVRGTVLVRADAKQSWKNAKAAKVDMELALGEEIFTGDRSKAVFTVGDDRRITLFSNTPVRVANAAERKLDVLMRRGRVRYEIEKHDYEVDDKVHAPSGTLAVRGTNFDLVDRAGELARAIGFSSRMMTFEQRQQLLKHIRFTSGRIRVGFASAAALAQHINKVDALNGYRSARGGQRVDQNPERGGDDQRRENEIQSVNNLVFNVGSFLQRTPDTVVFLMGFGPNVPLTTKLDFSVMDPNGVTINEQMRMSPDGIGNFVGNGLADEQGQGSAVATYVGYIPGTYMLDVNLASADPFVFGIIQVSQSTDGGPLVPVANIPFQVGAGPFPPPNFNTSIDVPVVVGEPEATQGIVVNQPK